MTALLLSKLKASYKDISKTKKKHTVYTNRDGRVVNIITGKSKLN